MKFAIAPDSFKESLTAIEFCNIAKDVINGKLPEAECDLIPISDGGEGFTENLIFALNGEKKYIEVTGPYFEKVKSYIGYIEDEKLAIIEMAKASGLELVPVNKRDTKKATTYGTGELIKYALELGAEKIIIGIGGSATTDAGAGMAAALGYKFYNSNDEEFIPVGENLDIIKKIDFSNVDKRLFNVNIQVACDVDNPLYGKEGSAYVYAKQKGATEEDIKLLDKNLKIFADKIKEVSGKDLANIPGSGAAGGLGFGLLYFANGKLEKGINIFLKAVGFENRIKDADFVITGEGKLDEQVYFGKSIFGINKFAMKYNIPVIIFCGYNRLDEAVFSKLKSVKAVFSICQYPSDLNTAIKNTREWFRFSLINFLNLIKKEEVL